MPLQTDTPSEVLREEMRLMSINFKVAKEETKRTLEAQKEKRNALRIGNDCLRHMTRRQIMMPVTINAKVFSERPRAERISMKHVSLSNSIYKNDGILFRYGKRLMKQDHEMGRTRRTWRNQQRKLADAVEEKIHYEQTMAERTQMYLHKQVQADEYGSRLNAARMIHQRLEKIHIELESHSGEFPQMINNLDAKIKARRKQLVEFKAMRDKCRKYVDHAERQLKPYNKELQLATVRFERAIAQEKMEVEEMKKQPISKFLADREHNAFNYTSDSNIEEMKIKARNKSLVNAHERVIALMDAMLVSDIKYVVDCINDQEDVTRLLERELAARQKENELFQEEIVRLQRNYAVLKYDDRRCQRMRVDLEAARKSFKEEKDRFENLDNRLTTQDRLCSDIYLSLHALFEKLRPIKLPDDQNNYKWELLDDSVTVILKLTKMKQLVSSHMATKVTAVKPIMLHYFKEKRVPPDSLRVDLASLSPKIQGFDSFEADQPGYVSREMLKQRYEESVGQTTGKKNKKGK